MAFRSGAVVTLLPAQAVRSHLRMRQFQADGDRARLPYQDRESQSVISAVMAAYLPIRVTFAASYLSLHDASLAQPSDREDNTHHSFAPILSRRHPRAKPRPHNDLPRRRLRAARLPLQHHLGRRNLSRNDGWRHCGGDGHLAPFMPRKGRGCAVHVRYDGLPEAVGRRGERMSGHRPGPWEDDGGAAVCLREWRRGWRCERWCGGTGCWFGVDGGGGGNVRVGGFPVGHGCERADCRVCHKGQCGHRAVKCTILVGDHIRDVVSLPVRVPCHHVCEYDGSRDQPR